MRTTFFFLLIATAAALYFTGCVNNANQLKLDHTNFTAEISPEQNLSFTFATDLVPDSLLLQWDTTEYIKFSPAIKGKFKWNTARELIFSPAAPFAPSTDFVAELTPNIFNHSKIKFQLPKEKTFTFHTPYLMMAGAQFFWALSQKNPGAVEVRMNINFNCKVEPAALKKYLHVFVNEKEVPFDLLSGSADFSIGVSIADVRGESKESIPLKIEIDPGLTCAGSSYVAKDKMEFAAEVPTKEKIMVTQMSASFTEGSGLISVFTNQPVVNENLNSLITVTPSITVTTEKLDNGFSIKGDFEADKTYTVTISKALRGIFGFTLEEDYSQNVSFGELNPMIAFADSKGMYLSSRGAGNIAVNVAAVSKVKVSVIHIYENNILAFMRGDERWGYYYEENNVDEGSNYHDYQYYDYQNFGDVVSEKTYAVQSLPKQGNVRLLHLNLDEIGYGDRLKGMYVLKVEDADRQWLQQSKFISLSDIGLMARQGSDEVYVFANSIVNAEPMNGVKVNFISTNNQSVSTALTDENGVAVLKNVKSTLGKFRVGMITCTSGDDFNFMILNNTAVGTSRFEVGGKYSNDANLDGFIYGDREIYRPGDSVHVNTVIRTNDWKVMKDIPMKIKLLQPNGKEYMSFKKTLNDQGAFETNFYLPTASVTGLYTIEVFTANDIYIAAKQFSVEEFVPDRIKITTTLDKPSANPGDTIKAKILAQNLFGPAAANRNYEVELQLNRKNFFSKKFSRYNFSINTGEQISIENVMRSGKTNEEGTAKENFELPDYSDIGILNGNIFTTVFDETGRPVHKTSDFTVNTQDVFYGIQYFDRWVSTRQPLTMQFIGCNISGAAVNTTARVEIYRYQWENVIQQSGGRYQYQSQRKDVLVSRKEISLNATGGNISFTPYTSGSYEVRISRSGADSYVSMNFWAFGWGDTQNTSFEVDNEGEVDLQLDKESYNIGDVAQVLLKAPFDGKILVTVERDHVFEYHYLTTEKKAASISIPIKEDLLPNVFITATAIRKMDGNQMPLTVARGYVPMKVIEDSRKLSVAITAAETSRSKTKQHISVKTTANTQLTIAVVDEGILQLKNTLTPDPYKFFYQQRALEVHSFDLYPMLLPEYATSFSNATGGDMAEMGKRSNPFTVKRFNLVALWSGILKSDAAGNASFDVNIPQFSGALRIMAVAYKDDAFGSAEKTMRVADPIVISTAMPRFLSPKDTVRVPVTLSNTTAKTADIKAEISVSGKVMVSGAASKTVSIKANSEAQIEFALLANNDLGEGKVTITINAMGEKFTDQTNIAVRPASALVKQTGSGHIDAGKSETISLSANMIPSTMSSKMVISKSPMTAFSKDLRYLIQYPYGCVEQTVSAAFPQLYFRDLAKAIGQENKGMVYNPDYNVQQAILKLESMQLYNGAITYWPGGDYESWWGSAYAAHFLLEAKKAGFDVNQNILDKIYSYLQQKTKERSTETYYYWDEKNIARSRIIASRETMYSLFVLALSGRYDQTAMNYYKGNETMLSPDSRYMLAATFALAGNQASYKSMLPEAYANDKTKRAFGGNFSSPIRDEALALYVLVEVDPNNQQIGIMARHLSEAMRKEYWLSTQESAFSFLALGKIARKAAGTNVSATISSNGKSLGTFTSDDVVINSNLSNQSVTIQTKGTGSLYYYWEVSGIDASGKVKEEDSYLRVRKTFYNRYGSQIIPIALTQNDLIVVKLSIEVLDYGKSIENVAVTDLLPAGFEIENPRISSVPDLDWVKDASGYDYMDIRDDRITYFCTATEKTKNFYYVVRAVSKGMYHMGPVSADAMYDGEYHSYWGAGKVIIK
ncbi:MAG: alpha-2-macroglobulin family protein [Chitinophagales bacterium]|nr:alpha-2-macroglobulin family protein [Chitinophagales bacterium]